MIMEPQHGDFMRHTRHVHGHKQLRKLTTSSTKYRIGSENSHIANTCIIYPIDEDLLSPTSLIQELCHSLFVPFLSMFR